MKIIDYFLAIPKTLYFNLSYFGIRGLKLPVLISHRVNLNQMKGQVLLPKEPEFAGIRLGFGKVPIFDQYLNRSIFHNEGTIIFKGRAKVGLGGKIVVKKNAELTLGNRFNMSAQSTIYCSHKIQFGDYNLLSWDVQILDSDLHDIYAKEQLGVPINPPEPIITGDSVWFCSRVNVLKGVTIVSNNVIASQANVTKSLEKNYCIYGGNPAKIIKTNICWDSAARDYPETSNTKA